MFDLILVGLASLFDQESGKRRVGGCGVDCSLESDRVPHKSEFRGRIFVVECGNG
jgi:hypothetical protein